MIKSQIQWTDGTVNFWTGCMKVSCGCKFCYMYRDKERYGKNPSEVQRTGDATFYAALKWKDPRKIFTCSWSDFFLKQADPWRADAWEVIRQTPHHQWQILTKRPERISQSLPPDWGDGWDHVWLGVSVETQDYLHRMETLSEIPAKIRFISFEPLLGPIDLSGSADLLKNFHWAIIGGESGNENGKYRYRPCEIEWFEQIIADIQRYAPHCKIFVKQLGTYLHHKYDLGDRHGGEMSEWPTTLDHIKLREFPEREGILSDIINC